MRKVQLLASMLMILGLLLSACVPTAPPGSGNSAGAADDGTVTLTFWHHWGGNRVPLMEEQIKRFEEQHPNIKVEMTLQPWENRLQKILTGVAGGAPPSVTMLGRQDVPAFVVQNALQPLDEWMARDGIAREDFYPSEISGAVYDGATWIMPMPTGGALTMEWYNKDWFAQVGLDAENPPNTWVELEEVAKALTILEDGKLQRAGIDVTRAGNVPYLTWLNANGGEWVSEDLKTVEFNSPEGLETLQWIVDFTNNINGGIEEVREFYSQTGEWENGPFYTDYEGLQINGSWELFKILEYAPDMNLGVTSIPYGPNGNDATRGAAYGGWGYVIPAGVEGAEAEAAWELVKFLTVSMDGACWFLQQQQRPSPHIACNEAPESGADNVLWNDFLSIMAKDKVIRITPVQPQIEEILNQMMEEALFGLKTPEEAIQWGAEEAQKLLDEYWQNAGS